MGKLLFFIIMLLFLTSAYSYTAIRLWQITPSSSFVFRIVIVLFIVLAFVSFFLSMAASEVMPVKLISALSKFGSTWLFITIYLLLFFLLLDLIRTTGLLPINKFMRESWLGLTVLTIVVGSIMSYGYLNYLNKAKREITISLNKPNLGKGIKAVFISDLHLGYTIGSKELRSWIELINAEDADVVLIAGDIIDNSTRPLYYERQEQLFGEIKSKYGTFISLGNHEYIAGIKQSFDFLERTGVTVLRDEAVLIDDRFYIVGRDDLSNAERNTLLSMVDTLDRSKPIILLDHQPHTLSDATSAGVDIQLSGHTHRGQIFPATLIADLIFDLSHGYRQVDNTHYYVSTGIGVWGGKFRIGSRSEYVVMNIE